MLSEEVEVRGHIIDSLILPKLLDEILAHGGNFKIRRIRLGKQKNDLSYARINVSAPSPEAVQDIVQRLKIHGAELVLESNVAVAPAPSDGVFPENFYVTTNLETHVHVDGKWIRVTPSMMDCGIAVDPVGGKAEAVKFTSVKKDMLFVVGEKGVQVKSLTGRRGHKGKFDFMDSQVSMEKPKSALIREVAQEIRQTKLWGHKILAVCGPAIVHTGADDHLVQLIRAGYIQLIYAGNALAVHDIEQSLFGTSLGVDIAQGGASPEGHHNHMRAINRIRLAGGIRQAVESGVLKSGIMYECVKNNVDYVLAGSIRDDGPLPDVVTDAIEAQHMMRSKLEGVTLALMMGTMLHSIAVGNMLSASVKTIAVDINPDVVTKLSDRGSHQAIGVVTDLEPFLRELTALLDPQGKYGHGSNVPS